jgi:predicted Zn-dependent protease
LPSLPKSTRRLLVAGLTLPALGALAAFAPAAAPAKLPTIRAIYTSIGDWFTNAVAGSSIENALFRRMPLPTGDVSFPRPPKESQTAISALIQAAPQSGELYALRAVQEEQSLNFSAAEKDWKAWVANSPHHVAAELDLANYYDRRLEPQKEIAALEIVAKAPNPSQQKFTAVSQQRSWQAFSSILDLVDQFNLDSTVTNHTYSLWIARYPHQPSVYSKYFHLLLSGKHFKQAAALVAQYRAAFPQDQVFPMQAEASLAARQQSVQAGLAIYNKAFDPLWPSNLLNGYYDLLESTHSLPAFMDDTRAALAAHPDDPILAAKLFLAWRQQGHPNAALQVIARYSQSKRARHASWTAQELYIFATLLKRAAFYNQAARYYFALYNSSGMPSAKQRALCGLIAILLDTPNQSLRIGAGNLSMYRDIATMDQGPGYLNGILSLLLNDTQPSDQYSQEDQASAPYFQNAAAARLLAKLDRDFPNAPQRAALHAKLIQAYSSYGEDKAVIKAGQSFLATFPHASQRLEVALTMADSYARTNQTDQEFALYQKLLRELAAQADGVPLGDNGLDYSKPVPGQTYQNNYANNANYQDQSTSPQAFAAQHADTVVQGDRSPQYDQVLDRYLADLVALHRLPQALEVLRNELQHDPGDPGIYNRLAQFLQQNHLGANVEEVYQRAIDRFQQRTWYDKLARFYLRQKRNAEYLTLTHQVATIFDGTTLAAYLENAQIPDDQLSLQVNLYAHQRFPHNLTFVNNLIDLYNSSNTVSNPEAAQKLLAQYWYASPDLRNEFFETLASNGQLGSTLASLRQQDPILTGNNWPAAAQKNPAAVLLFTNITLWQSHFATAAPAAAALADTYPANSTYGTQAAALYRSLAYFHPEDTARAVAIDKQLLSANPANLNLLARIGDTYADRNLLSKAAPYWIRMGQVNPGDTNGYLQAATVFWDYFDYKNALAELTRGRQASGNPAQYSYEEGAIYENKRDYKDAVNQYVLGAVANSPDSRSTQRLLALTARKGLQSQIDQDTASLLTQPNPTSAQMQLRAGILSTENKTSQLASELSQLIARSTSLDTLASAAGIAAQYSLVQVQQQALLREVSLTHDPTRRLQLQYDLASSYQSNNQIAAAQSLMDSLYKSHPKILGVVRATVDFDWSNQRKKQAIAVLRQAAAGAYPALALQFQFEIAHKLIHMQQYPQARKVLNTILTSKPYDSTALALIAQTYARAHNDKGLSKFFQSQIAALGKSSLPPSDRDQQIAILRRGLIPALTRLHKSADAIDQYIELLKSYPDDTSLPQEAALYAQRHQQQNRLLAYFSKASKDSPRNPHWPIILARLQTTLENYPAAIANYSTAIGIRPNRVDLHTARAALYEKYQQYDNAIADYKTLYKLSYHDPAWMVKIATDDAREGKQQLAAAALQTAFITGHTPSPRNYFQVAQQLEAWNMLSEALQFATSGVKLAGDRLLIDPANQSGAALYVKILTRMGKPAQAYDDLATALANASTTPTLQSDLAHAATHGILSIMSSQWRNSEQSARIQAARLGFSGALNAMARAAHRYDTPEQTASFVSLLQSKATSANLKDVKDIYLPAAQAGEFTALTAQLERRLFTSNYDKYSMQESHWVHLQRKRLLQQSAAQYLESFAPKVESDVRGSLYLDAAWLYADTGDETSQLRAFSEADGVDGLDDTALHAYFALLLKHNPQQLISFAGDNYQSGRRDAATLFALLHAPTALALRAVHVRGMGLNPVWTSSYTGLAAVYRRQTSPAMDASFRQALDVATIAQRLAHPLDHTRQLAGNLWFYYGNSYGEYLALAHSSSAPYYLPAQLEAEPTHANPYEQLAAWYKLRGQTASALTQYSLALQLRPHDPLILNHIALLLSSRQHNQQAAQTWQKAVAALASQSDAAPVPANFWSSFTTIVAAIGSHNQLSNFHDQLNTLLLGYIHRNGAYNVLPLLKSIYQADNRSSASMQWMLALIASNNSARQQLLQSLHDSTWLAPAQLPLIDAQLVSLIQHQLPSAQGQNRSSLQQQLQQWRIQWLRDLIATGSYAQAQSIFASIPSADVAAHPASWARIQVRLAAHSGKLASLIALWRQNSATAPDPAVLQQVAPSLDQSSRDMLMSYVYQSALARNDLSSQNFLGLAAIRIRKGDISSALSLLNRLVLVSGDTDAALHSAGELLYNTHHFSRALPFLQHFSSAQPWNLAARLRYDRARVKSGSDKAAALSDVAAIASNPLAPYATRVMAARSLAGTSTPGVSGSAELTFLAQGNITPAQAKQPYFIAARVAAASQATLTERIALLRQVMQIAPGDAVARIALLHAAIQSQSNHLTLSTAQPLIDSGYINHTDTPMPLVAASVAFKALPPSERAALYAGIALANRATGQLDRARGNFRNAAKVDPSAAARNQWLQSAKALSQILHRRATNAARAPQIHSGLSQSHAVWPRISSTPSEVQP